MMQNAPGEFSGHRERLVEHLAEFRRRMRESLAEMYEAESASPDHLAKAWVERPERLLEVVEERAGTDSCRELLEDLCSQHDIWIDISWSPKEARQKLYEIGLLRPGRSGRNASLENCLPGAVAAILSPRLRYVPGTYPPLLGRKAEDELHDLADEFGLEVEGMSRIELVLDLADTLSRPGTLDEILFSLPAPEYVGPALMALELGGTCYWQEVFGHELSAGDGKVVPLMRSDDRALERDMADSLVALGILFRVEQEDLLPMLILPEELWSSLWNLGRDWLMEWTASTADTLAAQGVRRSDEQPARSDLQAALKWFLCEADLGNIEFAGEEPTDSTLEHLVTVGGEEPDFWRVRLELARELGSFLGGDARDDLVVNDGIEEFLDLPRVKFQREVLLEWVLGYAGHHADRHLAAAVGLDEAWRERVVKLLEKRREFVPRWIRQEGVPPEATGAGILRNVEDSTPESLMLEMGILNSLVASKKLIWLDLLSMAETERWYPLELVTETLQVSAAFTVFSHAVHVLERPDIGIYYPVQRASFLTDPVHAENFELWVRDIVSSVLEPAGLARLSATDDRVWLDSRPLRIESPPGIVDADRQELMRKLFEDPDLDFDVPDSNVSRLRRVEEPGEEGGVSLSVPTGHVRRLVAGRAIRAYDGHRLYFHD